jgi:hypothetical protein
VVGVHGTSRRAQGNVSRAGAGLYGVPGRPWQPTVLVERVIDAVTDHPDWLIDDRHVTDDTHRFLGRSFALRWLNRFSKSTGASTREEDEF